MIKPFDFLHLENFQPNEFSNPVDVAHVLDTDSDWYRFSLLDGACTKCIVCFRETRAGVWTAFLLISEKFTALDGRAVRKFMRWLLDYKKASVMRTFSRENPAINRWHKFLGMQQGESTTFDGHKCNIWKLKHGG